MESNGALVVVSKLGLVPGEPKENRQKILDFEAAAFRAASDGVFTPHDFPVEHTFTEGAYARTMVIPKGSWIVGKIHKHGHLNFITEGKVTVATEQGVVTYVAPMMLVSLPGTKRVVFAHETTKWTTVHVTEKTNLEEIEADIIAKNFEEYDLLSSSLSNLELEHKKDT